MMNTIKMLVILFFACFLAAGTLAVVNQVTLEPINRWAAVQRADALKQVMTGAEAYKEIVSGKQWDALKGADKIGTVFMTEIQGYSGPIKIAFGIDLENKLTGVKVLSHTETPGLGAKIISDKFQGQYKGKSLEQLVLKKTDPAKGQIDAITAATISSRAVTLCLNNTLKAYLDSQPVNK
jgi:electron transport complex protein RnfG